MPGIDYDAVIAGAGVAGVAAAAALKELGWSVLVIEPGQHDGRRLGGELIHPAGVMALRELGLLSELASEEVASIAGFIALSGRDEGWANISLPYSQQGTHGTAIALTHARIRASLQRAAARLGHAEMLKGGRVVGVDAGRMTTRVRIQHAGRILTVNCRLVVAADGASSSVRALAGISHWRRPVSVVTGYVISDANLPARGFGHVFIGGSAPLLIYEIGGGRARVLFDQPISQSIIPPEQHRNKVISAIAYPRLRAEIEAAVAEQRGLRFVSADVVVEAAARNGVVLVGDAGGSCHPLTATGMTISVHDALRLRNALRAAGDNIGAALSRYGRGRRLPQRTRLLVASALHDAFSGTRPEHQLIRAGLIRYWLRDARGRQASMDILGMSDLRLLSALREILVVIRHGIAAKSEGWSIGRLGSGLRLMAGVTGVVMRQLSFAMRAK
jgi:squalene monooxygenase